MKNVLIMKDCDLIHPKLTIENNNNNNNNSNFYNKTRVEKKKKKEGKNGIGNENKL